ncbi:MAG: hypothetical protein IJB35_03540 [Oscillospiraceae bacterium]|nr:hypothetical protein [Oscillospiraceae bacterium]
MEFQYKGLQATLERLTVTQEEIDRQLRRLEGQDTSEFTPEELRRNVAESLQDYYDRQAEEDLADKLLRQAAATLDEVPDEAEIDLVAQRQLEILKNQLADRNLTLESYCQFMNSTQEQIFGEIREDAVQLVMVQKAIERIAELEQLTVQEEDVQKMCEDICHRNQLSAEELQELYDETFAQAIRNSILTAKVLEIVRNNARITTITL